MAQTASSKSKPLQGKRRIEERHEERRHIFDALDGFIEKCGASVDVGEIVGLFMTTLAERLKVKRVSVYLVMPEKRRIAPFRSLGIESAGALPSLDIDSALIRWLRETDALVHIDEFFAAAGQAANEEEEMMRAFVGAGLSQAIALGGLGDQVGILFLGGTEADRSFGERDAEAVKLLARVGSMALRNAFLHRTARDSRVELERFSELKHELLGHSSLELRTPLTVLKSVLWSLEPEEVESNVLVDMAKDAVLQLQGKVEYLLSLDGIELDKADVKLEPSEVSSVIEDALRGMIPELEEKQVRVTVDDQARYRKVLIDPGKIVIVIRSILDGAMSLVGRGGSITVTVRVREEAPGRDEGLEIGDGRARGVDPFGVLPMPDASTECSVAGSRDFRRSQASEGASYLVISVRDDGVGIPQGELETLAEPCALSSNSTVSCVKGLWIGLSVSRKVVAGHGGKIFCKSDLGRGTQFSIWLPLDL